MPATPTPRQSAPSVRVIVGETDTPARAQLMAGLRQLGNIEVLSAAGNGSDVVIDAWRHHPDMVLLDIALPGMTAAETTRHIGRAAPDSAVCLLTPTEGDPAISEAMNAGARFFLLKDAPIEQINSLIIKLDQPRG